jgi:hypothetical protein
MAGQERRFKVSKLSGLNITLHVAPGVTYNHKGPLIFYKEPEEPSAKQRKAGPPRRSMWENDVQFAEREKSYNDLQAKEDTTPKGNYCMTQIFFAQKILPELIKQI